MIEIDGSHGEGGGQILRTSLAIAALLGQEIEIVNIRANRRKPGLRPQHLCACRAAAAITGGTLQGAELGSSRLRFCPGLTRAGSYRFDVSEAAPSAGSTGMIFQTVLPPLAFAEKSSRLTLLGGTHTPWSPPVHYLGEVFLPALSSMGLRADIDLQRWGWYPRGGGAVQARVEPVSSLAGCDFTRRGPLLSVEGLSVVARLPLSIAERQGRRAVERLRGEGISAAVEVAEVPSRGPGTFIMLVARFQNIVVGFSALGKRGWPAEAVADEAVDALLTHLRSPGAVDPHLADQLVLYMALARGPSLMTTSSISAHLLTNLWVVERFVPGRVTVQGQEGQVGGISVEGIGFSPDRDRGDP
jgi:RNA 3'-terminal phosphate cyclase (ATP)